MRRICAVFLLMLLLSGCGGINRPAVTDSSTQPATEETLPAATIPPDGNPGDVTCKGSYTREGDPKAVVAKAADGALTNEQLAAWYWAEVAQYRASGEADQPDYDKPLDRQPCTADGSVASWQQYFLRRALNAWHTAAALNAQSRKEPLPVEKRYSPIGDNYEKYLTDMPAVKYLVDYNSAYTPNTMHQSYLDALPDTLGALAVEKAYSGAEDLAKRAFGTSAQALEAMAQDLNRAYMYFSTLTYYLPEAELPEDADTTGEPCVSFRHILLRLDGQTEEEVMAQFRKEAKQRLLPLTKAEKYTESVFADLAHFYSQDTASAVDGGAYRRVRKGQLHGELEAWCFAPERQPGDTTVITGEDGIHILYFSARQTVKETELLDQVRQEQEASLIAYARAAWPMEVTYSAILLPEAEGSVSVSDLLYPDIAHERFPEVPLYLQQDYPGVMYGGYELRTNGCGITSMAMLASYMTDEALSPPIMCDRYGRYSHRNGTDGMIFVKEPPVMGFYLIEKTYSPDVAWKALEDGYTVISIQHAGYWTRGGHYIVLEEITESGKVRVRDSNIYNYSRIHSHHIEDEHTWGSITSAGSGFWIFDNKVTRIPACSRCGDPANATGQLTKDFYCAKCAPAILRRDTFLTASK